VHTGDANCEGRELRNARTQLAAETARAETAELEWQALESKAIAERDAARANLASQIQATEELMRAGRFHAYAGLVK
jgi:hypothetical protein